MTVFTEGLHTAEGVISEANGHRSRDQIVIAGGAGAARVLGAGMVLGQITASGLYVQLAPGAADGSEVAAGILRHDVTAPDAVDTPGVAYVRDCEWNDQEIVWPAGITGPQQATATSQLEALGIILRAAI